jgi:putative ABC transport system substrate-binding protein
MPVVGFVNTGSADADRVRAFRKGLGETGYVEGLNVTVEYHWLEFQPDRFSALMADLVRRRVAVIAGNTVTRANAYTATIPIVFVVADDPVQRGLVASLARPGGNATGINILFAEVAGKRLGLLHELVPKAVRVAVLVNPANPPTTETTLRERCRKLPAPSGCKSRSSTSTPARATRSMRPLPPLRVSAQMPSSSLPTHFSTAAACK